MVEPERLCLRCSHPERTHKENTCFAPECECWGFNSLADIPSIQQEDADEGDDGRMLSLRLSMPILAGVSWPVVGRMLASVAHSLEHRPHSLERDGMPATEPPEIDDGLVVRMYLADDTGFVLPIKFAVQAMPDSTAISIVLQSEKIKSQLDSPEWKETMDKHKGEHD